MTETFRNIRRQLTGIFSENEIRSLTRIIAEQVCGIPYHRLPVDKDTEISENEKQEIDRIVGRLKQSEPIQYILEEAPFYDLTFTVSPAVLIPRPETEELTEHIIRTHPDREIAVLDVGTGSGCIAVTLARHLPEARVTAIDISEEALCIARKNAARHCTGVRFIRTDILDPLAAGKIPGKYDLIVSNPPYVLESEKTGMERNVLDYEPGAALFVPDSDPLRFYRAIARLGKQKLNAGGFLYFEINARFGAATATLLEEEGYRPVRLIRDLSGKDRIIEAQR